MLAVLAAACLSAGHAAWAWQQATPNSGAGAQQIEFNPPVEGTCRSESGSVARGRLVSISEMEVVMFNTQNRRVAFPTAGIRIIRTRDGSFQYEPANDDFADAVRRASELTGVTITTVYNQQPPNQPGIGAGNQGFANPNPPQVGVNPNPTGTTPQGDAPVYSSTPGFSNRPAPVAEPDPNATYNLQLRCTSCGELISDDSRPGQSCPHCGVFWSVNPSFEPAAHDTTGANSRPVGATAGGGAAQTAPQPAALPPPTVANGGSFSFDAMPLWQKVGAFVGFLAVLYLIVSGRR
jgi:hypothetical protein